MFNSNDGGNDLQFLSEWVLEVLSIYLQLVNLELNEKQIQELHSHLRTQEENFLKRAIGQNEILLKKLEYSIEQNDILIKQNEELLNILKNKV